MDRCESSEIVIEADPATVFDVLADPTQHSLFDGSQSVKGRVSGPPRLYLGAEFAMRMHWGVPYLIRNRVVEFEEDRRIAWRHFARHVWRYELEPVDGGTRVTETFDWSAALAPRLVELSGFPTTNAQGISATLERLRA